jgi:hypothetical protein
MHGTDSNYEDPRRRPDPRGERAAVDKVACGILAQT